MRIDKNIMMLAMVALGIACVAVWLILPVLSFNIVIPLFGISGITMAMNVSNITFLCVLVLAFMAVAPLLQNKWLCIASGIAAMVMCMTVLLAREAIITHGNLRWIATAASLLMQNVGSMFGETITADNINMYIKLVCEQFLEGGLGLWLVMGLSMIYLVAAMMSDTIAAPHSSGTHAAGGGTSSRAQGAATSASKGFKHRT